jgi:hypothetical protein
MRSAQLRKTTREGAKEAAKTALVENATLARVKTPRRTTATAKIRRIMTAKLAKSGTPVMTAILIGNLLLLNSRRSHNLVLISMTL